MPSEEEWQKFFRPVEALRKLGLKEGMIFADLGCGYGTFSMAAGEIVGPGGKVYAVDIDEEMLRRVKINAKRAGLANVKTIPGDINSSSSSRSLQGLPLRGADFVLLANVIHGAGDKIRLLKMAGSIARPGGIIAVVNWRVAETPRGPPMEMRPTPEKTLQYVVESGLIEPKVRTVPPYHYAVVAHTPESNP